MSDASVFKQLADICASLHVSLNESEIAAWALAQGEDEERLSSLFSFLSLAKAKQDSNAVSTLLRLSRIPQRGPMLFKDFDISNLSRSQAEHIRALATLSFIDAKRNIIMVGPPGTGKTHLAQAIGNECCRRKLKTYFIKMGELKDKFSQALRLGTSGRMLEGFTKYSCFIIDEVGYCHLDTEESRLFFQLVDRIDAKQYGSLVLTSNKELPEWKAHFEDLDALECTLDRLCDNAYCITFSGNSYRGKRKEEIKLDFGDK